MTRQEKLCQFNIGAQNDINLRQSRARLEAVKREIRNAKATRELVVKAFGG